MKKFNSIPSSVCDGKMSKIYAKFQSWYCKELCMEILHRHMSKKNRHLSSNWMYSKELGQFLKILQLCYLLVKYLIWSLFTHFYTYQTAITRVQIAICNLILPGCVNKILCNGKTAQNYANIIQSHGS